MDIELRKETVAINETVMRDNTQLLVQNDIIVPDVKSDMAKILQIDAEAMVDEVVVSDKRADIAGKLNLKYPVRAGRRYQAGMLDQFVDSVFDPDRERPDFGGVKVHRTGRRLPRRIFDAQLAQAVGQGCR